MKLQHLYPALALLDFLATPVTADAQLNCGDVLVTVIPGGGVGVIYRIDPATGDRSIFSGKNPIGGAITGSGPLLGGFGGSGAQQIGITVVTNCATAQAFVPSLSAPGTALGVLLLGVMAIYWHRRRSVLPGLR